jgi:mRNA interferase RelE/StbE
VPVRVELVDEAVADLGRYSSSGNLKLFLAKLVRLEEVGKDAGQPLGAGLVNWRKIVVGDRNWRIVFKMNPDETVATVWVVGDRDDMACYQEAAERVKALGSAKPEAVSLSAVMFRLLQKKRSNRL